MINSRGGTARCGAAGCGSGDPTGAASAAEVAPPLVQQVARTNWAASLREAPTDPVERELGPVSQVVCRDDDESPAMVVQHLAPEDVVAPLLAVGAVGLAVELHGQPPSSPGVARPRRTMASPRTTSSTRSSLVGIWRKSRYGWTNVSPRMTTPSSRSTDSCASTPLTCGRSTPRGTATTISPWRGAGRPSSSAAVSCETCASGGSTRRAAAVRRNSESGVLAVTCTSWKSRRNREPCSAVGEIPAA